MADTQIQVLKECDIYIDIENKLLKVIWKPVGMLDNRFKELLNVFSETVAKYKPESIFVDARQHKHTILADTQKWHDEVIVPRYVSNGVKRMGFITPNNIFSELSHKNIFEKDKAKSLIDTRFFDSEKVTLEFLLQAKEG